MDLSTYRREYAAFCSTSERERHAHHPEPVPESRLAPLRERYADLWTRASIDALRQTLEDTSPHFETERMGLRALINSACREHLESRASEISFELVRCEASSHFNWMGERVAASEAPHMIAREADTARRRELAARWLDAARSCDDLRASRLELRADAARTLGFDGLCGLEEDTAGVRLAELATGAQKFLERTAHSYASHLARWAVSQAPSVPTNTLSFADAFYFRRAAHLDVFFPLRIALAAYRATINALGVRSESQKNLLIEEGRKRKDGCAACFALKPPEEVRLVTGAEAGAESCRSLFFEAGRAQHFAWVSTETAARHPEFVYAPDTAARDGAGFLLAGLLRDADWVGERLGLRETEASALARSFALLDLEDTRRACAGLQYARALCESTDVRSEHLGETYVSLHHEATRFAYQPATHLLDADAAICQATRLRAILFAASLREHLRARHGRRWHGVRAAGDELIDIWNTASRYHAEELARLAWGGELDFDLLAEDLEAALDGD